MNRREAMKAAAAAIGLAAWGGGAVAEAGKAPEWCITPILVRMPQRETFEFCVHMDAANSAGLGSLDFLLAPTHKKGWRQVVRGEPVPEGEAIGNGGRAGKDTWRIIVHYERSQGETPDSMDNILWADGLYWEHKEARRKGLKLTNFLPEPPAGYRRCVRAADLCRVNGHQYQTVTCVFRRC